jgi:hypothetical protein
MQQHGNINLQNPEKISSAAGVGCFTQFHVVDQRHIFTFAISKNSHFSGISVACFDYFY